VTAIVGIDLAWTSYRESGICILQAGTPECEPTSEVVGTGELADRLDALGPDVVAAIDAPLIVHPDRQAERLLAIHFGRYHASAHSAKAAFIEERDAGQRLAEELKRRGWNLDPRQAGPRGRHAVEVYPHAAHIVWYALSERICYKRKLHRPVERCRAGLRQLQDHLRGDMERLAHELPPICTKVLDHGETLARGKALKQLEDKLDALTCALAAHRVQRDGVCDCEILGEPSTGYVVVPGLHTDSRFGALSCSRVRSCSPSPAAGRHVAYGLLDQRSLIDYRGEIPTSCRLCR
jgi:predicted RNase H-like nuclease